MIQPLHDLRYNVLQEFSVLENRISIINSMATSMGPEHVLAGQSVMPHTIDPWFWDEGHQFE